jgi:taurine dioxygenase
MFVSMADAWSSLPDDLRQRVQALEARHGHEHSYANRGGDDDVIDAYFENSVWTIAPLANPHPRTGRVGLYVSEQVTMDIVGLSEEENEALLAELFAHLYRPEHILEHDWHQNDLVIWDNQAVQHARKTVALDGPTRTLRKVTGPPTVALDTVPQPTFSKVSPR